MEKMSRHPIPLNPSFLPPATHGVLKSLLENPMKLPLHHEGKVRTKCAHCPRCARQSAAPRSLRFVCGVCELLMFKL